MHELYRKALGREGVGVRYIAYLIGFFVIAGVFAIFFGRYGEKELITGVIRANQYAKVHGETNGVVSEILVKPGQKIKIGQELFKIKPTPLENDGDPLLNESREMRLARFNELLKQARADLKELGYKEKEINNNYEEAISTQTKSRQFSDNAVSWTAQQIPLLEKELIELEYLLQRGSVKRIEVDRLKHQILEAKVAIENSKYTQTQTKRSLEEIKSNHLNRINDIIERKRSLQLQIIEVQEKINGFRREAAVSILSPYEGIVDSIMIRVGDQNKPNIPVATIKINNLSANDVEAILFVPTNKIGLMYTKQLISLRVDTFPYETYGLVKGEVAWIPESPISVGTDSNGKNIQVYPVTVKQNSSNNQQRSILSFDKLRDGMTVMAYVSQPQISIFTWLFMPAKKALIRNEGN